MISWEALIIGTVVLLTTAFWLILLKVGGEDEE